MKNLLRALFGLNPYEMELEDLQDQYAKAVEKVQSLTDLYFKSLDMQESIKARMNELVADMARKERSCQVLTDNLRERVMYYECQVEEYRKEIKRLELAAKE